MADRKKKGSNSKSQKRKVFRFSMDEIQYNFLYGLIPGVPLGLLCCAFSPAEYSNLEYFLIVSCGTAIWFSFSRITFLYYNYLCAPTSGFLLCTTILENIRYALTTTFSIAFFEQINPDLSALAGLGGALYIQFFVFPLLKGYKKIEKPKSKIAGIRKKTQRMG
ncbi:MAG: hypothetical protein AAFZ17_00580 [Cyanobacteria bacterium J06650_10]